MSPDAFRRLALFAVGCLIAGALMAVAVFVSVLVAIGAFIGGTFLAVGATMEQTPSEPKPEPREAEGLSRRDVARLAAPEVDDIE